MNIKLRDGLPFIKVELRNKVLKNTLVDTESKMRTC